jgi:hypothetical protein
MAAMLLVGVIVFASVFGVQAIMWWKVKQFAKSERVLWVIPQPLRDTTPSMQHGLKLAAYGYEFEVPWADLDKDKTRSGDSVSVYYFRSGQFLMFHNPARAANAREIFLADNEGQSCHAGWGEKTFESNFNLTRAMLEIHRTDNPG